MRMGVTAELVSGILDRSGRPVTERVLRDWAAKLLLPPRRRIGRGRGKGVGWVWDDPGVVRRATIVYDLLAWHGRTSSAWLPLWVLGYDIPAERARASLVRFLDGWYASVAGDATDEEEVRDRVYVLAERVARAPRATLPAGMTEGLIARFLDALLNPAFDAREEVVDDIAAAWRLAFPRPGDVTPLPVGAEARAMAEAVTGLTWLQQVSVPQLRVAVAAATPQEIRDAGSLMGRALAVFRRQMLASAERRAALHFLDVAPWGVLTGLGLLVGPLLVLALREKPGWLIQVRDIIADLEHGDDGWQ